MSKNILFRGQTRKKGEKVTMSGTPIPSSRYYAANQREEAIAKAKEIALNRGDTESIHSIETAPLIHVYDDRFVTKNPQSWKAPGDEFCNTLEEITETAGDALAAGLLVICATAKSVKRG